MKFVAFFLPVFFVAALAHASSKYAGEYFLIARSYSPFTKEANLVAGVNITIADDGTVTGNGSYIDLKPISITGEVKESGRLVLNETTDGQQTKLKGLFNSAKEFSIVFPSGLYITGKKLDPAFPEAGIYHTETGIARGLLLFVDLDGFVHARVRYEDGKSMELRGSATASGFRATSGDGIGALACAGVFHGDKFEGSYDIGDLATILTGAKY